MSQLDVAATDECLSNLLARYARSPEPISVEFRHLLRVPTAVARRAHNVHPYPAKLLPNIPSFFLASSIVERGDNVLDPFCGSGTSLLEAIASGRNAIGADANPLARLITRAKLTPIEHAKLQAARSRLVERIRTQPSEAASPDVVNLQYWFFPHVVRQLNGIASAIRATRDKCMRDFFSLALSACVREVSLADPRLSVPVKLRYERYPAGHWLREKSAKRLRTLKRVDVLRAFMRRLEANAECLRWTASTDGKLLAIDIDARSLRSVEDRTVGFAITSPPYVGAQKYIRASSLSLGWLGLCGAEELRTLEDHNIGREHFSKQSYAAPAQVGLAEADRFLESTWRTNPLRAHIASTYLREMTDALREMHRVLRPKAHLLLIVGENQVCGRRFKTPAYLAAIAQSLGLRLRLHLVDPIRSRALMTRRHRTAACIDSESVMLLQKD